MTGRRTSKALDRSAGSTHDRSAGGTPDRSAGSALDRSAGSAPQTLAEKLEVGTSNLRKRDKRMARLVKLVGPCRLQLEEMHSPFASLAEAIIYQQLTGKAAATICGRVKEIVFTQSEKTTKRRPSGNNALRGKNGHNGVNGRREADGIEKAFPEPHLFFNVTDEMLRGAGLSRAKIAAIRDLSEKAVEGFIPTLTEMDGMTDDELVALLTQVRGVGRWTVEMLLIFRLGRLDVMPSTDYGVQKGFALLHGHEELPKPRELLERSEIWRPHRSIASWYLWRALELPKGML